MLVEAAWIIRMLATFQQAPPSQQSPGGPTRWAKSLLRSGDGGGGGLLRWDASWVERDSFCPVSDVSFRCEGRTSAEDLLTRPAGLCVRGFLNVGDDADIP